MSLSEFTGTIVEFVDTPISLKISNGNVAQDYVLKVYPSTVDHAYHIELVGKGDKKNRYCTTSKAAKEHILLALDIARISKYEATHHIQISVPFLPTISMPAKEIDKAIDIVKNALDMYF